MGSVHTAYCECGFKADVTVGGGRYSSKAVFPFYCSSCGLVEVNTAPLTRDCSEVTCPQCNAAVAVQYGAPPVSLYDMRPGKAWHGMAWHGNFGEKDISPLYSGATAKRLKLGTFVLPVTS